MVNNHETIALEVRKLINSNVEIIYDEPLVYYGLNSLKLMQLIYRLENLFHFSFTDEELSGHNFSTVSSINETINKKKHDIIIDSSNNSLNQNEVIDNDKTLKRCVLRGGCDLRATHAFLSEAGLSITSELTYVSDDSVIIRNDHIEILNGAVSLSNDEKLMLIKHLPFYDEKIFSTVIFDNQDVVVLSLLRSYYAGLYRHKVIPYIVVPFGSYNTPLQDIENWDAWFNGNERTPATRTHIPLDKLNWFKENFEFIGAMSESTMKESLQVFREKLPGNTKLILVNGSETDVENGLIPGRSKHYQFLNRAVQEIVNTLPNTFVVNINQYIQTREDLMDNIGHYKRHHYKSIAGAIARFIHSNLHVNERDSNASYL